MSSKTLYKTLTESYETRISKRPSPSPWVWEISAACFALLCLAGLTALLAAIDNKPVVDWKVATVKITPNALVSIITTFMSAAILLPISQGIGQLKWVYFAQKSQRLIDLETFDEASRGPWGAFRLICKIRMRALVASIGAALLILSLAMGPFSQQLLSYPIRTIKSTNTTATIGRATVASSGGLPRNISQAILRGVFSRDTQSTFNCPTGHCTWPTFETMAICTHCSSISYTPPTSCHTENVSVIQGFPRTQNLVCNYTISDGNILRMIYSIDPPIHNPMSHRYWQSVPVVAKLSDHELDHMHAFVASKLGLEGSFLKVTFMQPSNFGSFQLSNGSLPPLPNAYECTMSFCVKEYSSSVETGTLKESVVARHPLYFEDCPKNWAYGNKLCFGSTKTTQGQNATSQTLLNRGTHQSNPARYGVDQTTVFYLVDGLLTVFPDFKGFYDRTKRDLGMPMSDTVVESLKFLFENDFGLLVRNVGDSFTRWIRDSSEKSDVMKGDVMEQVPYIHVDWAWLVFPAMMVALAGVFLGASIVFAQGNGKLIWKSSALALMFHGVEGWPPAELKTDSKPKDLDKAAKDTWVQLKDDSNGGISFVRSRGVVEIDDG